MINDPIEAKLNKFKRLLDESVRTEYGPYVDFGARLDKNNSNFKQLNDVFGIDTKFLLYEKKLINLIHSDWRMGEEDEK